jgi:glucose/arabinose dehydrogenase
MNAAKVFFVVCLFAVAQLSYGQQTTTTGYPYRVETIETPPGLVAETGGVDVLPDGRLVAVFRRGEVMFYDPATAAWSLFAKGLHDPLGVLALDEGELLVAQRPEVTRLKDTDGDGQADLYQTVTDEFGMSGNYAEFTHGPVMDEAGSLYFSLNTASNNGPVRDIIRGEYSPRGRVGRMFSAVPYRGWVMKVTPDGETIPWASGFRSPNGLALDRAGNLFVPDNQGDWLGTSKLYHVRRGAFYGHASSLAWEEGFAMNPLTLPVPVLDKMRQRAAVLFPQGILANSPTQPVFDYTGGRFGPFEGQLFIGEMNHPLIMRVVLESVQHQLQGAVIPFINTEGLRIGNNRLAFGPDGSLWVGQTDHGWPGDRGIQRIVWDGRTPFDVHTMRLTEEGFDLTFTRPVDPSTAQGDSTYRFTRYYYAYGQSYGSSQRGVKPVPVTGIDVAPGGERVSITLDELKAGYIYQLDLEGLRAEDGTRLVNRTAYYTLNHLRPPGSYEREERTATTSRPPR